MQRHAVCSGIAIGMLLAASTAEAKCKKNQPDKTKYCLNPDGSGVTRGPGGIFVVVVPKPESYATSARYLAAIAAFRREIGAARQDGTISQAEFDRGVKAVAAAPATAQRRFPGGH